MESLRLRDLAAVVHSAGAVFNGLSIGGRGTGAFLRPGSLEDVTSRADLEVTAGSELALPTQRKRPLAFAHR